MDKLKVFISYSSFDRSSAFEIMHLLEKQGCNVWLDFFDIKPSEVLKGELTTSIQKADLLCLLLSPTSVASKWVTYEAQLALEQKSRGLRILPVILRPCRIPDSLDSLIGCDVSNGLADEATMLRLVRAVLGREKVDDAVLLTAGKRAELAKVEMRQEADLRFPDVARELDRVRNEPIRELSLSIDMKTFPVDQPTILELRLTLDPLWTVPMSFYFAPYREGATWPEEFGFHEPAYTEYFNARRSRVDCKFQWFDRVEEPIPTLDGTDFGELPATFTVSFDGNEFQPGGRGPHLPQKFEIPSLQRLVDKRCRFSLIAHHPSTKSTEEIELALTDIDIVVAARLAGAEPAMWRLFKSCHGNDEKVVLSSQRFSSLDSEIEREALLSLYPMPSVASDHGRKARLVAAIDADQPIQEEDRRLAARLCFGEALLASVRGDDLKSLKRFEKTAHLMQPIVLDGYPTYEEGVLMYKACANLVGYFLSHRKYARAADFVNGVGAVAQKLVDFDPQETDYWRLWADALLKNATVHGDNGDLAAAAGELSESVETWRRLHKELPSRERLIDARKAFATATNLAQRWGIESQLPLDEWRPELDPDRVIERAVLEEIRKEAQGPVWLEPADPKGWPTVPFESPLLRYALHIPQRWSTTPKLNALPMEVEHVFRGPWPTEWLIVSFMEKASAGRMTDWVDAVITMTGFPVLAMTSASGASPRTLEWLYEGMFEGVAKRLGADEAHCYSGIAQLPGGAPRLARLYILLARRGTFAWKITLSFETACLPGMPADVVVANDHVRAGAVLGEVRLGESRTERHD